MKIRTIGVLAAGLGWAGACGQGVPVDGPRTAPEAGAGEPSPEEVFLEAWRVIGGTFYDRTMNGVDWEGVRDELLPGARAAGPGAGVSGTINEAIGRLHASHTHHYAATDREFYELLDVFYPDGVPAHAGFAVRPGPVSYVGIGLAAQQIGGRVFALDVYDGGPAARAGILVGDELLGVEDGPWGDVAPFAGREGRETRVKVQRTADPASRREIAVVPERIRPRREFLEAERKGARIIGRDGVDVAYVRIRSYANQDYHDLLKELLRGRLAAGRALVLDIRGGWGGASPEYMDIFNPYAPVLTHTGRDGEEHSFEATWRKPVVVLIDGGSRSGKEVLAYAFKKHRVGRLVGERTAGAVLGGRPRALGDGSVLYVAVTGATVDGEVLEGVGVEPDVKVAREIPYCEGRDEQLKAAVGEAVRMVREVREAPGRP